MTSFLISEPKSAHLFHWKWGFSVTFLFLNQFNSKSAKGFKIACWFLFRAQKEVLVTISDNMTQKSLFYTHFWRFFGQTPLRNSVVMTTPKVPGNQKLFERVCYMLKLKVTKFQLSTPNGFRAVFKKASCGRANLPSPPPLSKIGLSKFAYLLFWRETYPQTFPLSSCQYVNTIPEKTACYRLFTNG